MKRLIALLFINAGLAYVRMQRITNKIFILPAKKVTSSPNSLADKLAHHMPFTLLLLGYGGGNRYEAYLTDSMMVVHIDPKQEKVFLISIPRDIWVKIPTNDTNGNYWKINAAYTLGMDDSGYPNKQAQFKGQDGGGKLAAYMVSQVTGLAIDYFVSMDFSGFIRTIDALGGVDLTVEKTFDDYQYPIDGKENDPCGHTVEEIASLWAQIASQNISELEAFPCRYEHLHFDNGTQHMDGATALKYVRSRYSLQDGTDFGRTQRQRNLLIAVKQKIFSAGFIPHILPFMSSLSDSLKTDMPLDDVKTLTQNANILSKYQIIALALTNQNKVKAAVSNDGQRSLVPKDGLGNWTSVQNYLSVQLSGKIGKLG